MKIKKKISYCSCFRSKVNHFQIWVTQQFDGHNNLPKISHVKNVSSLCSLLVSPPPSLFHSHLLLLDILWERTTTHTPLWREKWKMKIIAPLSQSIVGYFYSVFLLDDDVDKQHSPRNPLQQLSVATFDIELRAGPGLSHALLLFFYLRFFSSFHRPTKSWILK